MWDHPKKGNPGTGTPATALSLLLEQLPSPCRAGTYGRATLAPEEPERRGLSRHRGRVVLMLMKNANPSAIPSTSKMQWAVPGVGKQKRLSV